MSIRWKFILWGSLFYSSSGFLLYQLYQMNKWYFVAGEFLLLLSFFLFLVLYKQLVKPLETISSATLLLQEKDFSTRMSSVKQKEINRLINVYNKMSEQLHNERVEHEEKNLFLERLIEASPSSIIILNKDREIIKLNPAAHRLLTIDIRTTIPFSIDQLPAPWCDKLKHLKDGDNEYIKIDGIRRFKASYNSFMDKGFANPFILIEEMTRELIQAEKQSYEMVIRMMSHEVNNSVGAVNSVMQSVLSMDQEKNHCLSMDAVQALEVSIERNKSLNRFMANFAGVVKLPPPQFEKVDFQSLLQKIMVIFNSSLKNNSIELNIISSNHFLIDADSDQMEQVLVNIIKNSIEAIGHNGTIEIDLHETYISIKDNGTGFSEQSQEKLFMPFFSTKVHGQGIGLTLVREILLNHHFSFKLHRLNEKQTEFLISFKEP